MNICLGLYFGGIVVNKCGKFYYLVNLFDCEKMFGCKGRGGEYNEGYGWNYCCG